MFGVVIVCLLILSNILRGWMFDVVCWVLVDLVYLPQGWVLGVGRSYLTFSGAGCLVLGVGCWVLGVG